MKSASLRSNPERLFSLRNVLVRLAGIAYSLVLYLLACEFTCRIGFPLDDSWIYLSYARNLALRGEWSFLPVQPSAGSSVMLWIVLFSFMTRDKLLSDYLIARREQVLLPFSGCAP